MPTYDSAGANKRRDDRHEIHFQAVLVIDNQVNAAQIENISVGGAKLKTAAPLTAEKGTPCELRVEGLGDFPALVAWAGGGVVGIAFEGGDWRLADALMAMAMHS